MPSAPCLQQLPLSTVPTSTDTQKDRGWGFQTRGLESGSYRASRVTAATRDFRVFKSSPSLKKKMI